MYIWKTKLLAKKLKTNELTQKDIFKYFLFATLLNALQVYYSSATKIAIFDSVLIISVCLTIGITTFGLIRVFKINSEGDGKAFVERFICLALPISIKITLAKVGIYVGYIITAYILNMYRIFEKYETILYGVYYAASYILLAGYFMLLAKYFKLTSHNNDELRLTTA